MNYIIAAIGPGDIELLQLMNRLHKPAQFIDGALQVFLPGEGISQG